MVQRVTARPGHLCRTPQYLSYLSCSYAPEHLMTCREWTNSIFIKRSFFKRTSYNKIKLNSLIKLKPTWARLDPGSTCGSFRWCKERGVRQRASQPSHAALLTCLQTPTDSRNFWKPAQNIPTALSMTNALPFIKGFEEH